MRTPIATVAALVLLATVLLTGAALPAGSAPAAAPFCAITWGSLERAEPPLLSASTVQDVRAGRHACFDRLVVDLAGPATGYDVRYVDVVTQPGSGFEVPLRGAARLQVLIGAPAYDVDSGTPVLDPADRNELVDVTGWRTFRQVALAGSFEGSTDLGLGVRARLPFRVFTLDGPGTGSRLVIDVAHRW